MGLRRSLPVPLRSSVRVVSVCEMSLRFYLFQKQYNVSIVIYKLTKLFKEGMMVVKVRVYPCDFPKFDDVARRGGGTQADHAHAHTRRISVCLRTRWIYTGR